MSWLLGPDTCAMIDEHCRSASPQGLEGSLVHDPTRCESQLRVKPLSRRIQEANSPPIHTSPGLISASAERKSFTSTSYTFPPPSTLDNSSASTTEVETNLATIFRLRSPKSIPSCLEALDRMSITDVPSIPTRELPPLDPSLVPYCFVPKPYHPLRLPRIDARAIANDATEVETTDYSHSFRQVSRNEFKRERRSFSFGGIGVEAYSRDAYPITNETSRQASASSPIAPGSWPRFSVSPSRDVTPNTCCSGAGSTGSFHTSHNTHDRLEQSTSCFLGCTCSQAFVAPPSFPGQIEGLTSRYPGSSFGRVAPDTHASLASWTRNLLSYIPGDYKNGTANTPTPTQASDYPSRYPEYPVRDENTGSSDKGGGRKGKGRSDGNWQGDEYGGGEKGYGGGQGDDDDDDDDGSELPRKKVPKKTPMACHFCRGRKLKCDGGRPTCGNCARRSLACAYDETVRRRGPGRKNRSLLMQKPEEYRDQHSEASTSTTTPVGSSSSSMYRDAGQPPMYNAQNSLPGPPLPQYPYAIGQIQPTNIGPASGSRAIGRELGGMRGQESYRGHQQYSQQQYTTHHRPREYSQQQRQEPYYEQPAAHPQLPQIQQGDLYRQGYAQAPTPGYSSQIGSVRYRGGPSTEGEDPEYPSEGDDEGTSGSHSKRHASSPPEDNDPSNYQRRKYDYDRGAGA